MMKIKILFTCLKHLPELSLKAPSPRGEGRGEASTSDLKSELRDSKKLINQMPNIK